MMRFSLLCEQNCTLCQVEPHHLHLITVVCDGDLWVSEVPSRARDSPESVASAQHISDELMLHPFSCSFPFLWGLWRHWDYFANKSCDNKHLQLPHTLITCVWHINTRKPVNEHAVCLRVCQFSPSKYVEHFPSFLWMFLWWQRLDVGSFIVWHSLGIEVLQWCDTVRSALQSGGIWYSAPSPD